MVQFNYENENIRPLRAIGSKALFLFELFRKRPFLFARMRGSWVHVSLRPRRKPDSRRLPQTSCVRSFSWHPLRTTWNVLA